MLKSIKDLVSEEIKSEESLIEDKEQVAPDQIEGIINQILIFIEEAEGVHPDDEIEEAEFARDDECYKSQSLTVYYFLRNLLHSDRKVEIIGLLWPRTWPDGIEQ